eukprot:TRINITY_DN4238_c0_g1_i1.p1 TRINITY_DN4238_c0_g1~~TRINITY_DN4238_c0_g1_i1.p1  ORF type:complete len:917 (-),score=271.55 TRINITY_DN4238_c0_g1_i1:521-3271(-)
MGDVPAEQRVRVGVRVRPINRADQGHDDLSVKTERQMVYLDEGTRTHAFPYDFVFGSDSSQKDFYDELGVQVVKDAWDGYNSTVFAYGQTGSGKTYSMTGVLGDSEKEGLMPRVCREIFRRIESEQAGDRGLEVIAAMSYLEVYNEQLFDLQQSDPKPSAELIQSGKGSLTALVMREKKKGGRSLFYADNLRVVPVRNTEMIFSNISSCDRFRRKAETDMNAFSSRSHAIFVLTLAFRHNPPQPTDRECKITLVDLAGSEKIGKTGNTSDDRLKEAQKINLSLMTLGRCLMSFGDGKAAHVPTRDSVLTKLLSDVFGGNSRTIMLATISPTRYNFAETKNTLDYATSAKKIRLHAKQNFFPRPVDVEALRNELDRIAKIIVQESDEQAMQRAALNQKLREIKKERKHWQGVLAARGPGGATSTQLEELQRQIDHVRAENVELEQELNRLKDEAQDLGESDGDAEDERVEDALRRATEQCERLALADPDEEAFPDMGGMGGAGDAMHGGLPPGAQGQDRIESPGDSNRYEIRSYFGHKDGVYSSSFSPDGRHLVSCGRDETVRIWDVMNGFEKQKIQAHKGHVLTCAFHPNGREVASGGKDAHVKTWDVESGSRLLKMSEHNSFVYCIVYSRNGSLLASASKDKRAKVWDSKRGKCLATLKGHLQHVTSVQFANNDPHIVVTGSADRTIKIWNWQGAQQVSSFPNLSDPNQAQHASIVWSVCFSPDDNFVLSSSQDSSVRLWDRRMAQPAPIRVFRGHTAPVHHAIFLPRGDKLVSASRDRTLKVWNADTGVVMSTLIGHLNTVYRCDVYHNAILSCASDSIVKIWHKSNLTQPCSASAPQQIQPMAGAAGMNHPMFQNHPFPVGQGESGYGAGGAAGQPTFGAPAAPSGYGGAPPAYGAGGGSAFGAPQSARPGAP